MPVILAPHGYELFELWLDPGMTKVDAASDLSRPFDARLSGAFP
jgi:hypothetical protein